MATQGVARTAATTELLCSAAPRARCEAVGERPSAPACLRELGRSEAQAA
ncbi:MAG TPA: hypothetical protein VG366_06985 [Solirubrobacteraceae bacterium]|nr:hypothetical protein [Solirubrobacteraceae bacterium]